MRPSVPGQATKTGSVSSFPAIGGGFDSHRQLHKILTAQFTLRSWTSPSGSVNEVGSFRTYAYLLVSPAENSTGSSEIKRPIADRSTWRDGIAFDILIFVYATCKPNWVLRDEPLKL